MLHMSHKTSETEPVAGLLLMDPMKERERGSQKSEYFSLTRSNEKGSYNRDRIFWTLWMWRNWILADYIELILMVCCEKRFHTRKWLGSTEAFRASLHVLLSNIILAHFSQMRCDMFAREMISWTCKPKRSVMESVYSESLSQSECIYGVLIRIERKK